jgi:hypothetical protein
MLMPPSGNIDQFQFRQNFDRRHCQESGQQQTDRRTDRVNNDDIPDIIHKFPY